MGKPNYRVIVSFDPQRAVFTARAPELEHLTGDGPSRKDAISKLEEEIESQLANMLSHGTTPPRAVDEVEHNGEVHAKVSRGLHRDLAYLATSEGVELDQIVSELLAAALAVRQNQRAVQRAPRTQSHEGNDDIGNRVESHHHGGGGSDRDGNRADGSGGGPRRPVGRGHNPQILDDRANFIEYVRGLEQTGGAPARGPSGHRGGGGGGGQHNNNNRRRRGGGGGGPQPGRDGNRHQGGQQHRGQQHGRPQQQGGGQAPQAHSGTPQTHQSMHQSAPPPAPSRPGEGSPE